MERNASISVAVAKCASTREPVSFFVSPLEDPVLVAFTPRADEDDEVEDAEDKEDDPSAVEVGLPPFAETAAAPVSFMDEADVLSFPPSLDPSALPAFNRSASFCS